MSAPKNQDQNAMSILSNIKLAAEPDLKTIVVNNTKKERMAFRFVVAVGGCIVGNVIWNHAPIQEIANGISAFSLKVQGWKLVPPDGAKGKVAGSMRGLNNIESEVRGAVTKTKQEMRELVDEMKGNRATIARDIAAKAKEAIKSEIKPFADKMEERIERVKDAADKAHGAAKALGAAATMVGPLSKLASFGQAMFNGASNFVDGIQSGRLGGGQRYTSASPSRARIERERRAAYWREQNLLAEQQIGGIIENGARQAIIQNNHDNQVRMEWFRRASNGFRY